MRATRTRSSGTVMAAVALVATIAAAPVPAQVPPRSVAFPDEEVSDEFFAYVMGIFYGDLEARVSGMQLIELLPEFADGESDVPFYDIEEVRRYHTEDSSYLTVDFTRALRFPAPVNIMGYRPAHIETTQHIALQEEYLHSYEVDLGRRGSSTIRRVRVFRLISGHVRLLFAEWIDRLLGELVDNVDATTIITLWFDGQWYAIVGAVEPDGDIITGVVDLKDTSVMIRPPRTLRDLAEEFMTP